MAKNLRTSKKSTENKVATTAKTTENQQEKKQMKTTAKNTAKNNTAKTEKPSARAALLECLNRLMIPAEIIDAKGVAIDGVANAATVEYSEEAGSEAGQRILSEAGRAELTDALNSYVADINYIYINNASGKINNAPYAKAESAIAKIAEIVNTQQVKDATPEKVLEKLLQSLNYKRVKVWDYVHTDKRNAGMLTASLNLLRDKVIATDKLNPDKIDVAKRIDGAYRRAASVLNATYCKGGNAGERILRSLFPRMKYINL